MLIPHVLPVLKGSTVIFSSHDTLFHILCSDLPETPSDLAMYEAGEEGSCPMIKAVRDFIVNTGK